MNNIELKRHGNIFVLTMKEGENRFNRNLIDSLNNALDEVENSPEQVALVTTGEGKFYSNGLDLDWMSGLGSIEGDNFINDVDKLYVRFLTFPVATVACINGHAFGGGAIMALAHDYRVMRIDRGYFCLPEIDLGLSFTSVMNSVIMSRFHGSALRDVTLTGARFGGEVAREMGIIDDAVPENEVLKRGIAYVEPLTSKDKNTMRNIKKMQYEKT